jgi:hemerythrin-like domain-containing protein
METVRFNPFHQVHQALRALLYHASITVQHTDFTKEAQAAKTIALLEELVSFFEAHAYKEDTQVFPLISKAAPELVADFEAQHEKDHELGEELVDAIHDCRNAVTDQEKILAGKKLQRALNGFTAFNLTHMNAEETVILDVLHREYTDEQLLEREQQIVASLTPAEKAFSGYWMLKGLAMNEIIDWYKKIRAAAPSFVFDEFMLLAEKALSAEKLKALQQSLNVSLV